jgi:glucose-6-phosphate-specific signal transduction histidine kinase
MTGRAEVDHQRVDRAGQPPLGRRSGHKLLGTAVRSAGLALEHVAAQARLRAELADLAASRRRIIEDADAERRSLKRDLHDGAQQRLIGLQLFMQLAADDAAEEQAETYRAARRIVSTALADLRDLAHGIHPAALTDDGLMTGLRTLANRSPVPLSIGGTGSSARSAVAEATAYRLVAYTAHTAGRLDGGPAIRVTVDGDEAMLRIRIEADALGGEQAAETRGCGRRRSFVSGTPRPRSCCYPATWKPATPRPCSKIIRPDPATCSRTASTTRPRSATRCAG